MWTDSPMGTADLRLRFGCDVLATRAPTFGPLAFAQFAFTPCDVPPLPLPLPEREPVPLPAPPLPVPLLEREPAELAAVCGTREYSEVAGGE